MLVTLRINSLKFAVFLVNSLALGEEIERKYARLSKDAKKRLKYGALAVFCYMFAFSTIFLAVSSFLAAPTETGEPAPVSYFAPYWIHLVIGFIISGAIAYVLTRKWNQLEITEAEQFGVVVYHTYKILGDFIDSNLKNVHRQSSKKKIENLIYDISLWKGAAPSTLYEPIDQLIKSMKDKLLPIIQKGNRQQVEQAQVFLRTFLAMVDDASIRWDTINILINELNAMTAPTPQQAPKPTRQILQEYPFLKFAWLGVPFGVVFYYVLISQDLESGFALAYAVPSSLGLVGMLATIFRKR